MKIGSTPSRCTAQDDLFVGTCLPARPAQPLKNQLHFAAAGLRHRRRLPLADLDHAKRAIGPGLDRLGRIVLTDLRNAGEIARADLTRKCGRKRSEGADLARAFALATGEQALGRSAELGDRVKAQPGHEPQPDPQKDDRQRREGDDGFAVPQACPDEIGNVGNRLFQPIAQ